MLCDDAQQEAEALEAIFAKRSRQIRLHSQSVPQPGQKAPAMVCQRANSPQSTTPLAQPHCMSCSRPLPAGKISFWLPRCCARSHAGGRKGSKRKTARGSQSCHGSGDPGGTWDQLHHKASLLHNAAAFSRPLARRTTSGRLWCTRLQRAFEAGSKNTTSRLGTEAGLRRWYAAQCSSCPCGRCWSYFAPSSAIADAAPKSRRQGSREGCSCSSI